MSKPHILTLQISRKGQEGENALKMHILGSNFYLFNFISFIDKKPSSDSLQAFSSSLLLFKTLGKISPRHKEEKDLRDTIQ